MALCAVLALPAALACPAVVAVVAVCADGTIVSEDSFFGFPAPTVPLISCCR